MLSGGRVSPTGHQQTAHGNCRFQLTVILLAQYMRTRAIRSGMSGEWIRMV
jgi:hypothetical protein